MIRVAVHEEVVGKALSLNNASIIVTNNQFGDSKGSTFGCPTLTNQFNNFPKIGILTR